MDISKLQEAYKRLDAAICEADKNGYQYSHAPLTEDLRELIPQIKSGTLKQYVKLANTQGIQRCFSETLPESCYELREAYAYFIDVIEGRYEDSEFLETMAILEDRFKQNRKNWGLE